MTQKLCTSLPVGALVEDLGRVAKQLDADEGQCLLQQNIFDPLAAEETLQVDQGCGWLWLTHAAIGTDVAVER